MTEVAISGRALLDQAAERLRGAGVESPRLAARRLWSDLQGDATLLALLTDDATLDSAAAAQYLGWVERLAAGEPLAYVTGWTGFRHLRLRCDARALIPRPETEVLVELALARVRTGSVADIGTGTGAIALALRQEGEFTSVIGVDCSADALTLASENGAMLGLAVEWRLGDLLAPIAEPLDLLVSNPPYLTEAEYATLDASVRDHEPRLALPSGEDGLEAIRRLLDGGRAVVREGGWIALELDCRRAAATAALAEGFGWREVLVQDDLFGRARYLLARRGSA
ncbi:MAG: peptide chain release factor N(5)-glutamine methyltransferase [Gemmatimonadales bacterium]|nr:peptide chain release factor N(5)-glutamine methyltransferase [Gemmatimonadales bacterium]